MKIDRGTLINSQKIYKIPVYVIVIGYFIFIVGTVLEIYLLPDILPKNNFSEYKKYIYEILKTFTIITIFVLVVLNEIRIKMRNIKKDNSQIFYSLLGSDKSVINDLENSIEMRENKLIFRSTNMERRMKIGRVKKTLLGMEVIISDEIATFKLYFNKKEHYEIYEKLLLLLN